MHTNDSTAHPEDQQKTSSLPSQITADINGEISGQVAVGTRIIQIGSVHGGVVNIATSDQQPRLQARSTPVFLLPRPFPDLIGRQEEIKSAIASLKSAQSVELYSPSGFGKSVLLRHLAYHPQVRSSFVDGAISFNVHHQTVADLLQSLFEVFYASDIVYKPTEIQIRQALQDKRALILLDAQKLTQNDIEELINAIPNSTFLLALPERRLWGETQGMRLQGLPIADALILLERELQRSLTTAERQAAEILCTIVEGNPLQLILAAATVREERRSLSEVVSKVQSSDSLIKQILESLPNPQRVILAVLAALGGVALLIVQAAAMSKMSNTESILQILVRRNLVQTGGDRYSLSNTLIEAVQQEWDLTPWRESALEYFTTWTQQYQTAPSLLLAETDAIFQTLEWAVGVGRWTDVLRLVKAVEGAFALGKQWGLWEQVLHWGLQAAQTIKDKAAEAWALHQLGSRALCLEDMTTAENYLNQALQIRESLGDEIGVAVTRHNLNFIPVPPPQPEPAIHLRFPNWLAGVIAVVFLILGGLLVRSVFNSPEIPKNVEQPLNKQPVAEDDIATINYNTPLSIAVLANDQDLDGNELNIVAIETLPQNGITRIDGKNIIYQPKVNYSGVDVFTYSISDRNGGTDTAIVSITVEKLENKPPIAEDDTVTTKYNTPRPIAVLANDQDPDGGELNLVGIATQPQHGTVTIDGRNIIYEPKVNYFGTDKFTYTISDRQGQEDTATINVTIEKPLNKVPQANPDAEKTSYFESVNIQVLENDQDPDGDSIKISNFTQGENGNVSFANDQKSLIYQPNRGFSGEDRFTYTIQDTGGGTANAKVTITVAQESKPALKAVDDQRYTKPDGVVRISVLDNDIEPSGDSQKLRIIGFTQGQYGKVDRGKNGTLVYKVNSGVANITDTFTYTIQDADGATDEATVTVIISQFEIRQLPNTFSPR